LETLQESTAHLSTDDLVERLADRGTPLPRGSVYNVVGALVSHGLMMVTDIGPGRAIYELADRWHHHFVCRNCGRIEDVECVVGERPCLDQADVDGEVDEAQVIFRGLCASCSAVSGNGDLSKTGDGTKGRSPVRAGNYHHQPAGD
jgi:Fur family ferric uptake transcriptional regulator